MITKDMYNNIYDLDFYKLSDSSKANIFAGIYSGYTNIIKTNKSDRMNLILFLFSDNDYMYGHFDKRYKQNLTSIKNINRYKNR